MQNVCRETGCVYANDSVTSCMATSAPPDTQLAIVHVVLMQEQYADETFVHVLPAGQIPHTRHVRGSNFTYISVFPDRLPGRAIIIAGTPSPIYTCGPGHGCDGLSTVVLSNCRPDCDNETVKMRSGQCPS